jgi:hypothetical protein
MREGGDPPPRPGLLGDWEDPDSPDKNEKGALKREIEGLPMGQSR